MVMVVMTKPDESMMIKARVVGWIMMMLMAMVMVMVMVMMMVMLMMTKPDEGMMIKARVVGCFLEEINWMEACHRTLVILLMNQI